MPYADEFDAALAELAPDWASFECYLTVDDPLRLADARVALARANGRPVHGDADHDFHMPARSGWTREETCRWLAERVVRWAEVAVPVPAGQPIDSQQDTR